MPTLVPYPDVLQTLRGQGLISLYFNSGAFGFPPGVHTVSRGWIGPQDASIRESARGLVRQANEPYAFNLAQLLERAWKDIFPGVVWLMPKSHWAYELEFGSKSWMPSALGKIGIDPCVLQPLNNAAAIQFEPGESALKSFAGDLLTNLNGSDFQLVFLARPDICTIHSRCQLWWTTADPAIAVRLDDLL